MLLAGLPTSINGAAKGKKIIDFQPLRDILFWHFSNAFNLENAVSSSSG